MQNFVSDDKKSKHKRKKIKVNTRYTVQELRDILSEVHWENVHTISNTDKVYNCFLEIFLSAHNLKLPVSNITIERRTLHNP